MARLSLSPSGGHSGRRLSELLDEKQEPFSLDLHLLEKGCPTCRLLDAATPLCWPRSPKNAAIPSRPTAASKNASRGSFLRLLLSKILRSTANKKSKPAATLDWDNDGGGGKKAISASPRCFDGASDINMLEDDSDGDDGSKQLSPVSVLELPFDQTGPAYGQSKLAEAMDIFRELLEATYAPAAAALLDEFAGDGKKAKGSCHEAAHWEERYEAELALVAKLIASEMAGARVGPADVRQERRDVAADVAEAVLDELREDVVVELLAMGRC